MEKVYKKKKKQSLQSLQSIRINNKLIYNVPYDSYDSSWFETEDNINLSEYINTLFTISKKHLKSNVHPDTIKGIFVPHAGIKISGLCSASAYYQLLGRTKPIKRIILLCTNHQKSNSFISTSYTDIASCLSNTNTNTLKFDTTIIEHLKPYLKINNQQFLEEHSFFNQLPFIESIIQHQASQHASQQASQHTSYHNTTSQVLLLPFLISNSMNLLDVNTRDNIRKILNVLIQLLNNRDTVLICTSDLSHINGQFDTKIRTHIHQNIRNKDSEILQFMYDGINGIKSCSQNIDDVLFIQNAPTNGTIAMYFFSKILNSYVGSLESSSSSSSSSSSNDSRSPNINKQMLLEGYEYKNNIHLKQLFPRVCCYYTSLMRDNIHINNFNPLDLTTVLNTTNTLQSSVSYAGIIFTTQSYIEKYNRKIENMFSQYEKIALIGLVREQMFKQFNIFDIPKIPLHMILPINCQVFSQHLGVFISIYKDGKLRSCTGTTETQNDDFTIITNIKKYTSDFVLYKTKYKALNFEPLLPNEFNKLSFNISILNNIKEISINEYFGNKFKFGQDGLIVKDNKQNIKNMYSFSLTSIDEGNYGCSEECEKSEKSEERDGIEYSNIFNKKHLLETLCNIYNKNEKEYEKDKYENKNCYKMNNIKLYYNEGINIIDTKI